MALYLYGQALKCSKSKNFQKSTVWTPSALATKGILGLLGVAFPFGPVFRSSVTMA